MAELFSLMPGSTSCNDRSVEASRSYFRAFLPASYQMRACAAGEISRDACSPSLCARCEAGCRFPLEMTLDLRTWCHSERACLTRIESYTLAQAADIARGSRPWRLHTLSTDRAMPSLSVGADGPSAFGGASRPGRPRMVQKSPTEKAAKRNPSQLNRQHFQGVYFLSH